jgi:hypothetical protein
MTASGERPPRQPLPPPSGRPVDLPHPPGETAFDAAPLRPRRRTDPWAFVAIGLTVVIGLGAAFVVLRLDDAKGPCEAGAKWEQAPTNRTEGTVLSSGSEAGVVHGGALIGFPDQQEAAAMGHVDDFVAVSQSEFDAIDRVPREGLLFRERSTGGRPGRYFYSAAGAVFEVKNLSGLAAVGLTPSNAIPIPRNGLDSARRVPPTGTLLRIGDQDDTWVVDGGARRVADRVCDNGLRSPLPADRDLLDAIPVAPDSGEPR